MFETIKKLKAGQKQLMEDVNELAKMKASPGSAEKVKALAKKVQKEAKSNVLFLNFALANHHQFHMETLYIFKSREVSKNQGVVTAYITP